MTPAQRIAGLASRYKLRLFHNPGGGEFLHPDGTSVQVSLHDEVQDLQKLQEFLADRPEPPKTIEHTLTFKINFTHVPRDLLGVAGTLNGKQVMISAVEMVNPNVLTLTLREPLHCPRCGMQDSHKRDCSNVHP